MFCSPAWESENSMLKTFFENSELLMNKGIECFDGVVKNSNFVSENVLHGYYVYVN
jgi:hypothetical protein